MTKIDVVLCIFFKSVQVCGGCCKMFRGAHFFGGHSVVMLSDVVLQIKVGMYIRCKQCRRGAEVERRRREYWGGEGDAM